MLNRSKQSLALGLAIALASQLSLAGECNSDGIADLGNGSYKKCSGLYLGAGLGLSKLEPRINNLPESLDDTTGDVMPNLILGYDINEDWAIEATYADQGEATFDSGASIEYRHWALSGLYYLPSNLPGLSAYLKAGVGQLKTDLGQGRRDNGPFNFEQLNDTQVSLGAGAEYRFTNDWGLRLEALYVDKDTSQLTLNLVKRFGRDYSPPPAPVAPAPAPAPVVEPPKTLSEPLCKELKGLFDQVFFKVNSDELTPASTAVLSKIATALQPFPQIALEISAHTDAQGSDAYNQALSERRAQSAVRYLEGQGLQQLTAKGYGESRPVADNKTAEGRAKNRRVEMRAEGGKVCE
jgi:outer membrane protein OmpA-like peptidoglycan-associated protein